MQLFNVNESPLKTTKGHQKTSSLYKHVNSLDICKQFEALGFEYLGTSSANVRDKDREGFQKHLMAFSRPDLVLSDGERMQILCLNSHDASTSLRFNIGVFRAACANGLVSGDSMHEQRVIHMGDIQKHISEQIRFLAGQAERVKNSMQSMKDVQLSFEDSQDFLKFAADQRLSSVKNLERVALNTIDKVRRKEDYGQDLWTVFNRIQESVIKGGIEYEIKTERINPDTKQTIITYDNRTTREIKESKRVIDLNRNLWRKALEFVS